MIVDTDLFINYNMIIIFNVYILLIGLNKYHLALIPSFPVLFW